jgi:manganese transport protein
LGFAVIPLIHFVSDKKTMGEFVIKPVTKFLAWLITAVLVYLNIKMVAGQTADFFAADGNVVWKVIIVVAGLVFMSLLLFALIYPMLKRSPRNIAMNLHRNNDFVLGDPLIPMYNRIAVALDFSNYDQQMLAYALGQANKDTTFLLIHIVESASAKILGQDTDDLESRSDKEKLDAYGLQLQTLGYNTESLLGFSNRQQAIAKIVNDEKADLLIIGAHGHSGVKDWFYGETIEGVRHQLKIPVLIVRL